MIAELSNETILSLLRDNPTLREAFLVEEIILQPSYSDVIKWDGELGTLRINIKDTECEAYIPFALRYGEMCLGIYRDLAFETIRFKELMLIILNQLKGCL